MTTHQLKRLLPLFTLLKLSKLPKSTIKQQPQKTTNIFAASWMSVRSSYSYFPSSYWLSLTCKFYHQKKVKKIIKNIGILYFHTAILHKFMLSHNVYLFILSLLKKIHLSVRPELQELPNFPSDRCLRSGSVCLIVHYIIIMGVF